MTTYLNEENLSYALYRRGRVMSDDEGVAEAIKKNFFLRPIKIYVGAGGRGYSPINTNRYRSLALDVYKSRISLNAKFFMLAGLMYAVTAVLAYVNKHMVSVVNVSTGIIFLCGFALLKKDVKAVDEHTQSVVERIQYSEGLRHLNAPAATALVMLMSSIYLSVLGATSMGYATLDHIVEAFALVPSRVFNGHEYMLATGVMLHVKLFHVVVNMLGLYIYGSIVEKIFSWKIFLLTLVVAAEVGAFGTIFLSRYDASVGISGGLYGLGFFLAAVYFKHRDILPRRLAGIVIISLLVGLIVSYINRATFDIYAHGFGSIAGIFMGVIYNIMHASPRNVRDVELAPI